MQRLIRRRGQRDRGAAAVWVGVLMVPLLVVCALAIDIASANADQQRLQTGADAAALAIAQDCARSAGCTQAAIDTTAHDLASQNSPLGGPASATASVSGGVVRVQTRSERQYLFAPVIGENSVQLSASAAATWGAPSRVTDHFPLTVSWCQLDAIPGVDPVRDAANRVIGLNIPAGPQPVTTMYNVGGPATPCNPTPQGNTVPGGFGWLERDGDCLRGSTSVGNRVYSNTGNNPGNCEQSDLQAIRGQIVLIPIYGATGTQNSVSWYDVIGFAALRVESWYFAGQVRQAMPNGSYPCGNNNRCIRGTIERFVDLGEAAEYGGTVSLGTSVVTLRLP